jgi:hypothetical protein
MNSCKLQELLAVLAEHGFMALQVCVLMPGSGNLEDVRSIHLTIVPERMNSTKPLELLFALEQHGYTAARVDIPGGGSGFTGEVRLVLLPYPNP